MVYLDTSALAKRYLSEPRSDQVDDFLAAMQTAAISRLCVLELTCLLARRRRNREIDSAAERRALAAFDADIANGFLEVHPLEDRHAIEARELTTRLTALPLRTLDALHLAIAAGMRADLIATADRTMAAAARALRIGVEWFGARRL